jgi:hypothetical protein
MKDFLIVMAALFGLVIGFLVSEHKHRLDNIECNSYSTKHSKWDGYLARNEHGDIRCFWLEREYPWRIRQGVPV